MNKLSGKQSDKSVVQLYDQGSVTPLKSSKFLSLKVSHPSLYHRVIGNTEFKYLF